MEMKVNALLISFLLEDIKLKAIIKKRTEETKEKLTVRALILSSAKVK
jgi:hypothetical protein